MADRIWFLGMLAALGIVLAAAPARAGEKPLAFAVPGVVVEVTAEAGKAVRKGDVLARLDGAPFEARLRSAQARLTAARARARFAGENKARVKQLFDDLSTSAEELEKADLALTEARAEETVARSRVERAQWKLERATLKAPADGTVKAVPGFAGQVVDPRAAVSPVIVMD